MKRENLSVLEEIRPRGKRAIFIDWNDILNVLLLMQLFDKNLFWVFLNWLIAPSSNIRVKVKMNKT